MEIKRIFDIEVLTELRSAFLSEMKPLPQEDWNILKKQLKDYFERHIDRDDFVSFGISVEGRVVSCAFLVIDERPGSLSFVNGIAGTILNVYTYPEYQRRGYGQAVMEALMEEARNRKVSVLKLSATEAGKRLYEKLGFGVSHYTEMELKLD